MGVNDEGKRRTRRESFEPQPLPQPLHIPAPEQNEPRKENRLVDDEASGTHVTVIDIS